MRRMFVANTDESIVHVIDPSGDGEHTFCSLEMQEGSIDPGDSDKLYGEETGLHEVKGRLPNCEECKKAIDEIRKGIKGLRFAKKLISLDSQIEGYDDRIKNHKVR